MTTYTIKIGAIQLHRRAETAQDAIVRLCDQYGWGYSLKQFDADTRGREWAEMAIDHDGGINYDETVIAYRTEA